MKFKKKLVSLIGIAAVAAAMGGCGSSGAGNGVSSFVTQGNVKDLLAAQEAQSVSGNQNDPGSQPASENQSVSGSQSATESQPVSGSQSAAESQPASGSQTAAVNRTTASDAAAATAAGSPDIDVDLTTLSATMVYSEVYNMLVEPEEYLGKTVKMNGAYTAYHNETSDVYYFSCIIRDATACCAQGLEFMLSDAYTFPDDYPGEGDDITVVGVFDTYMEGNYPYYYLRDARLV